MLNVFVEWSNVITHTVCCNFRDGSDRGGSKTTGGFLALLARYYVVAISDKAL